MGKLFSTYIYQIGICYLILQGASSWFTINISSTYNTFIYSIIITTFLITHKKISIPSKECIILIVCICSHAFINTSSINVQIFLLLKYLTLTSIFFLKPNEQINIINYINRFFTVLISLSLFTYLLVTINFPIPSLGIQNFEQYTYHNYILCLDHYNYPGKFVAFCIEPGYYSVLASCLILVNKFNFKKYSTWIYLISILFSFSLGGYLLTIISCSIYYLLNLKTAEKKIQYIIFFLILFTSIFIISTSWDNGNNKVNEKIIERLEFDEEKGITGNNRENAIAEILFEDFFSSKMLWFGIGLTKYINEFTTIKGFDAASYKVFIIINGLLYTIIYILIFTHYCIKRSVSKIYLPVLTFYWLDFIQHGLPFSCLLIPILLFIEINRKKKNIYMQQNKLYMQKTKI